jgi:hypothetical protein
MFPPSSKTMRGIILKKNFVKKLLTLDLDKVKIMYVTTTQRGGLYKNLKDYTIHTIDK